MLRSPKLKNTSQKKNYIQLIDLNYSTIFNYIQLLSLYLSFEALFQGIFDGIHLAGRCSPVKHRLACAILSSRCYDFRNIYRIWKLVMHISLYDHISSYYEDKLNRVQNCFGNDFFPVSGFFWGSVFCPFSLLFAAFWSWKLPFQLQLSLQHFEVLSSHFP